MIRCLKDKAPKGSYLIRASVIDRLVDNKMYYKFVEYGNLLKEEEEIKREQEQEQERIEMEKRRKDE
jgi:hypothetical protein